MIREQGGVLGNVLTFPWFFSPLANLFCSAQLVGIMIWLACNKEKKQKRTKQTILQHSSLGFSFKWELLDDVANKLYKVSSCLVSSLFFCAFLDCHIQATFFREERSRIKINKEKWKDETVSSMKTDPVLFIWTYRVSSSLWKTLPEYLIQNTHKHMDTIQSAPIFNGRHALNLLFALHLTNAVQFYTLYSTINTSRDPITFLICWMDF